MNYTVGDLNAVRAIAADLMDQHGLLELGWNFGLDRARKSLGQCNFTTKRISVSSHWIKVMPESQVRETILHEIAHALAGFKAGHGPAWRMTARRIGANPKRCADVPDLHIEDEPTWVGTCPSCSDSVSQYRAPLRTSACSSCCAGSFKPRYILRWTKRGHAVPMEAMPRRYQAEMLRLEIRHPSWAFDHTDPANYR